MELSEMLELGEDICSQEAIHQPGSIQPHGVLVAFDRHDKTVVGISSNFSIVTANATCGILPDWLTPTILDGFDRLEDGDLNSLTVRSEFGNLGLTEVHCFASKDHVFCEAEIPISALEWREPEETILSLSQSQAEIKRAPDVSSLSTLVARTIQAKAGFERVLIYRFNVEGDGEVLGESIVPDWHQSFLGLRFPSSDIPSQARELYRHSHARWMPTRDYAPVPILSDSHQTFDLSSSNYRNVSPTHRAYQKNIDVDGSMSVSVMRNGELWGLVIGHHRKPHHVTADIRHSVSTIVRSFSMRLDALLSREMADEIERVNHAHLAILGKLAAAEDFLVALTDGNPSIASLLPGCSGAAIVWNEFGVTNVQTLGVSLPKPDLVALAEWVRSKSKAIFSTNHLSTDFPPFAGHCDIASGVIACSFDDDRRPTLLLFRPEIIHTIEWAGKPEKLAGPDGILNLPRRSFDRWTEIKRGISKAWHSWDLEIVTDVCETVNHVIIRQSRRIRQLEEARDAAIALSRTDGLTNIANRRWFDETLNRVLALSKRAQYPIGLLLIDIDEFKQFNDHYGHTSGDLCLIQVASAIHKVVNRLPDLAARYGGEEFVCLLPDTDHKGVLKVGEDILAAVRDLAIPHAHSKAAPIVTVSIGGISTMPQHLQTVHELVNLADQRLYLAKAEGRNRLKI